LGLGSALKSTGWALDDLLVVPWVGPGHGIGNAIRSGEALGMAWVSPESPWLCPGHVGVFWGLKWRPWGALSSMEYAWALGGALGHTVETMGGGMGMHGCAWQRLVKQNHHLPCLYSRTITCLYSRTITKGLSNRTITNLVFTAEPSLE